MKTNLIFFKFAIFSVENQCYRVAPWKVLFSFSSSHPPLSVVGPRVPPPVGHIQVPPLQQSENGINQQFIWNSHYPIKHWLSLWNELWIPSLWSVQKRTYCFSTRLCWCFCCFLPSLRTPVLDTHESGETYTLLPIVFIIIFFTI